MELAEATKGLRSVASSILEEEKKKGAVQLVPGEGWGRYFIILKNNISLSAWKGRTRGSSLRESTWYLAKVGRPEVNGENRVDLPFFPE